MRRPVPPRTAPLVLLAAALLLAGACGSGETSVGTGGESSSSTTAAPPEADTPAAELAAARDRWAAAAIDDYDMTYRAVCFCLQQVTTVEVRGGEVVTSSVADDDGVPVDETYVDDPLTVEAMFDDIDEAITTGAASVAAEYDPDTGRVISYYIDQSEMMADEEHGIDVTAFAPAGEGTTTTTAPDGSTTTVPQRGVDLGMLTEEWGCGTGLHLSDTDQRVAVLIDWTGPAGAVPAEVELPAADWTAEVRRGEDLFANWCTDVIDEPVAQVDETWPIVAGSIEVDLVASGTCGFVATVSASGLVAERSDGERVALGDLRGSNDSWGCFPG